MGFSGAARMSFFRRVALTHLSRRAPEMDAAAELTMSNLTVVGALSHNDKLLTNQDTFDIYAPTSLRAVARMWYGENRTQNLRRVRQAVTAGIAHATATLEEATALLEGGAAGAPPHVMRPAAIALQHLRMVTALSRAQGGLRNLIQTYRDDPTLSSQAQLLVEEIDAFRRLTERQSDSVRQRYGIEADGWGAAAAAPPRALPSPPPPPPRAEAG